MAESTGWKINCPVCGDETAVLVDKRLKYYLNCSCGLQKFNTEKGQAIIQAALDGKAEKPAVIAEKQPEPTAVERLNVSGVEALDDGDDRAGNFAILGVCGVILGGGLWILKNRARQ